MQTAKNQIDLGNEILRATAQPCAPTKKNSKYSFSTTVKFVWTESFMKNNK